MFKKIQSIFMILLGAFIFAFGLNYFIVGNKLAQGGFTGMGLLLHYSFGFSIGAFLLIVNIPLLFIAQRIWGWEFISLTAIGSIASSVFIDLTAPFVHTGDDLLLAAIFGGALSGLGLGLVLRFGGTTGGADIIGRLLQKYKGIRMSRFYLVFDACVISVFALIYGLEPVLYSLILTFIASKIVDAIVDGLDGARQFMIITSKPEEIVRMINEEVDRGVTLIDAKGGYTGEEKTVLLCVAGKWQVRELKKGIKIIDPAAFMIVSDVFETLGKGFNTH